ncbi:MAG: hypothetical protein JWL97_3480 [Gemmatimonadales bacterium]|nr:hypothetical protein [Gemmatimonadales bacterium]
MSQQAAIWRLSQVCEQWIYTACLCFGRDTDEQQRSGFRYGLSVYQAEYSRNLLFKVGAQMQEIFHRMLDRTRSRLDVPAMRTLFGAKTRPHSDRASWPPQPAVVIERPRYDLIWFTVAFGLLTVKGYTKGEHLLRFEATVHNTRELRCGRVLDKFPDIINRLQAMTDRFTTMLDCVDVRFITDQTLDQLPGPSRIGATRVGGIDMNKPRIRAALAAVLALDPRTRRFHRRGLRRQGPFHDRAGRTRLHHPPSRLRPAETPWQTVGPQTRPEPPLPGPPAGSPHHRRAARPARPSHRTHPRRRSEPTDGTQTPQSGPASTATTRRSASTCKPSSTTSASRPPASPHRQHFVDEETSSA